MSLQILSIQHDHHGLLEVEKIVDRVDEIAGILRETPGVAGVIALSTCNRVEFLVDAPELASEDLALSLAQHIADAPNWDLYNDDAAATHLFRVSAGLESMVVGEREIAGQVRRALGEAQDAGLSTPNLSVLVEEALKTSRRVARETKLSHAGRSVVSVALDQLAPHNWEAHRVLLVGTGSFAGASVAALRSRGVNQIRVHSVSGNADDFAQRHGLPVAQDLAAELTQSDLVVTCRGTGTPTITRTMIPEHSELDILDLSLHRDVAVDVSEIPGVRLTDLMTIQEFVSPDQAEDTALAEQIVIEGVSSAHTRIHSRVLDPAIVSLREAVLELVNDEVSRLPQDRPLEIDDAAQSLRRLATRLLHVPSSRARLAAASGRTSEYLSAMAELYGIENTNSQIEDQQCPATGLGIDDLNEGQGEPGEAAV